MELFKNQRGKLSIKLDTTEDRIAAFMMKKIDEDQLHQGDQEIIERWTQLITLLLKGHSPTQAVNVHKAICERKGKGISLRTAYYDLKHATNIWGSVHEVSYQANLQLLYEFAMQTFRLASKDRDKKEMNKAISEMREIIKELNTINAFDDDGHREPSKFILQINVNENQQMTFDLDNYEILPNDISEQVLAAVNDAHLPVDGFMKIVEESDPK